MTFLGCEKTGWLKLKLALQKYIFFNHLSLYIEIFVFLQRRNGLNLCRGVFAGLCLNRFYIFREILCDRIDIHYLCFSPSPKVNIDGFAIW